MTSVTCHQSHVPLSHISSITFPLSHMSYITWHQSRAPIVISHMSSVTCPPQSRVISHTTSVMCHQSHVPLSLVSSVTCPRSHVPLSHTSYVTWLKSRVLCHMSKSLLVSKSISNISINLGLFERRFVSSAYLSSNTAFPAAMLGSSV